ncbi:MAG: hypothetical protein GWN99_20645, partial [Gemmatimonadetes bacterium]|nr:hypothetical protein [Gemmatimonadota bacterium]NIS03433.1 hypothetical protein [Gemmatimonadota bacterium]NIT69299.1 hypothetical protein [Gemmatimonadota bacterium]NIU54414.1 hypothetical protein [Gemmatimonadota bacterium]NIV25771.1 hypothetical protein [Gemmatimonadota bacterium]
IVSKDLRVHFDPNRTTEGAIEEAIRSLGYTVERDGRAIPDTRARRVPVWRSGEAWLSYGSGAGLAVGLLLRISGLSPRLTVLAPLSGVTWNLDLAALLYIGAA